MLTRLARWWLARKDRRMFARNRVAIQGERVDAAPFPTGECICGKQVAGPDLHLVVAISDDDRALGIEGSTAVSADFCAEHCPGGCRRSCVPSEV